MHRFLPLFPTLVLLKQFAFAITFYYNSKTTKELPDYFLHFHLRIAQLLLRKPSKQMSMNPRPYPKNSIIICLTLSFMLSGNKISQRNFTSLFFFFFSIDFYTVAGYRFVSNRCQDKFYCCDVWPADEGLAPRFSLVCLRSHKQNLKKIKMYHDSNERLSAKHSS